MRLKLRYIVAPNNVREAEMIGNWLIGFAVAGVIAIALILSWNRGGGSR